MHWSYLVAAASFGLVASHGSHGDGQPVPNIMAGRRALEDARLHRREVLDRRVDGPEPQSEELGVPELHERQSVSRCGTGFGTVCDPGYCCSSAGWCGLGYLYCSAPSCQIDFGPGCDANIRPDGPDTTNVARPHVGPVPYGEPVYHCEEYGDIALTFDDGPYLYTEDLLNKLAAYNAKATFYITGNNLGKGKINDPTTPWPALIRRMVAEGHQIASHTWSHQRLNIINEEKFRNQMIYNEIAFADLLGYFPTYMRPPYSGCNSACETILNELGYHITYFNLDTEGYLHDSADTIQISKDIWDDTVEGQNPTTNKWLSIEHDPVYQSVYNLTDHVLESLTRNGFRAVTVGECLGDPQANWYRSVGAVPPSSSTRTSSSTIRSSTSTSTSSVPSPTGSLPPSINGRCGPNFGFQTCIQEPGATCCSPAGWCGNTVDHCGTGCQPFYGNCQLSSPSSSIRSSSTSSVQSSSSSVRSSSSSIVSSTSSVRSSSSSTVPSSSSISSSTRTTSSVASPTGTPPASTNGRCGPNFGGTTCLFEPGATCCSPAGWCGNTADHCGTGCQPFYGNCQISPPRSSSSSTRVSSSTSISSSTRTSSSTSTSSRVSSSTSSSSSSSSRSSTSTSSSRPTSSSTQTSSAPTSTTTSKPISTNGRCGPNFGGTTCIQEPGATCCSPYGWCGATAGHCGANCQVGYGTCGSSL